MKIKKHLSPLVGVSAGFSSSWVAVDKLLASPCKAEYGGRARSGHTHVASASQSRRSEAYADLPSAACSHLAAHFQSVVRPAQGKAEGFSPDQVQTDLSSSNPLGGGRPVSLVPPLSNRDQQ